jgi:hypothetical protein
MTQSTSTQTSYNSDTFKDHLKKLVQKPNDFTADDVEVCFRHFCQADGKGASDAQVRH